MAKIALLALPRAGRGCRSGVLGGVLSDWLIRRGKHFLLARKTPFVPGICMSMALAGANFFDANGGLIALMSIAFFGQGLAAVDWTAHGLSGIFACAIPAQACERIHLQIELGAGCCSACILFGRLLMLLQHGAIFAGNETESQFACFFSARIGR